MSRAVVFAYHEVGYRCLSVLLAHGVDVVLVLTHADDANENIWFSSVAELAAVNGLPCEAPDDAATALLQERMAALAPDFIFSFYYRRMLPPAVLATASRGAYNMHGSLLPAYRGRVPVNWAVINGERETGATLHGMVEKPDAGPIVAQQRVPILPDDTAGEVFRKVTVAAELALDAILPSLLAGSASHVPQDLTVGSYYGGRKPEDGLIDWRAPAEQIHNLVRGVAPPYPGAFTTIAGKRLRILRSKPLPHEKPRQASAAMEVSDERIVARCGDGRSLWLLDVEFDGLRIDAGNFCGLFGSVAVPLGQAT